MLPLRSHAWRLCGLHACSEESQVALLGDRSRARAWLQPFKTDTLRIAAMRSLLSRDGSGQLARMSNEAIIDAIAGLLSSGRLHVHADPIRGVPAPASAPVEAKPVPFPFAERQPRPSVSMLRVAAPSDSPTFGSDADMARQAGTLVAAASQGAPFCRMCSKAS